MQGQFKNHVHFLDGMYVVALPWKDLCLPVPYNYRLSLLRLNSFLQRMKDMPLLQVIAYDSLYIVVVTNICVVSLLVVIFAINICAVLLCSIPSCLLLLSSFFLKLILIIAYF